MGSGVSIISESHKETEPDSYLNLQENPCHSIFSHENVISLHTDEIYEHTTIVDDDCTNSVTVLKENKNWTLQLLKLELSQLSKTVKRNVELDNDIFFGIVTLCKGNTHNQESLNNNIEDIVKLIKSTKAVSDALQAIVYLCRYDGMTKSTQCKCNVKCLGLLGICEYIVNILKKYGKDSIDISRQCYKAINSLIPNYVNNEKFGKTELCEIIVEILRKHGKVCELIVKPTFKVIINLAFIQTTIKKFWIAGACDVIVDMLKLYGQTNADICKYGCIAIYNLTANNNNNKENFNLCGLTSFFQELEVTYKSNKDVQNEVKDIMKQLA